MLKVNDYVSFFSCGTIRYDYVARITNGIVWLKSGQIRHIEAVKTASLIWGNENEI